MSGLSADDEHLIAPIFYNIKNDDSGPCDSQYKEYAVNFCEALDGVYEFFEPIHYKAPPPVQCTVCNKSNSKATGSVLRKDRIISTKTWAYAAKDQCMQLNLMRFVQLATVIHIVDKIQFLCDDCQAAKMKFESLLNRSTFTTDFAEAQQAIYQDHKAFYAAQSLVVKKFQDLLPAEAYGCDSTEFDIDRVFRQLSLVTCTIK
jgi:hypothetical protein